jgi:hypothetical protein
MTLGIVITYFNFAEFVPKQLANFKKYVKSPYKVFIVDDSNDGLDIQLPISEAVVLRNPVRIGNPSTRHQNAVNVGMSLAKLFCDTFLIFDNDMLFMNDFYEPLINHYMPIVSIIKGKKAVFPWLNLLYTTHYHYFEFKDGSDSGGSFPTEGAERIKNTTCDYDFILAYKVLCEKYNIAPYYDILDINGAIVFHFRAMSNYTQFPEEFMIEKRELIMRFSEL